MHNLDKILAVALGLTISSCGSDEPTEIHNLKIESLNDISETDGGRKYNLTICNDSSLVGEYKIFFVLQEASLKEQTLLNHQLNENPCGDSLQPYECGLSEEVEVLDREGYNYYHRLFIAKLNPLQDDAVLSDNYYVTFLD